MTSLSRAFLAAYPPVDVLDAIDARLAAVRAHPVARGVRAVPRDQWHVTLRFCGHVPDAEVLTEAVTVALTGCDAAVDLQLVGAGAFPTPRRASVLWVGFAPGRGTDALARLAAAAEKACLAAGLPASGRPFHPHVTVIRSSRARDLRPLVDALGPEPVGSRWTAGEVRLVASDTRSDGAVHEPVARFPLGRPMIAGE